MSFPNFWKRWKVEKFGTHWLTLTYRMFRNFNWSSWENANNIFVGLTSCSSRLHCKGWTKTSIFFISLSGTFCVRSISGIRRISYVQHIKSLISKSSLVWIKTNPIRTSRLVPQLLLHINNKSNSYPNLSWWTPLIRQK